MEKDFHIDWFKFTENIRKIPHRKIEPKPIKNLNAVIFSKNDGKHSSKILDLHGFNIDQAYEVVCKFIFSAYNNNIREILIITGKSNQDYSIKSEIQRWFELTKLSSYILNFKFATPNQGGEGALLIKLKKRS